MLKSNAKFNISDFIKRRQELCAENCSCVLICALLSSSVLICTKSVDILIGQSHILSQDTSHRGPAGKSGHYISLRSRNLAKERTTQLRKLESDIRAQLHNPDELEKALMRAQAASLTSQELMESDLPGLLMGEVRVRYSGATKSGRTARRYPILNGVHLG